MSVIFNKHGQAMIEAALIMVSVFIVLFMGLRFMMKCNIVKLEQEMELRQVMFSRKGECSNKDVKLQDAISFMRGINYGETVSTKSKLIKIPEILWKNKNESETVELDSSIFILKGSWNTAEMVNNIRGARFGYGSINELIDDTSNSNKYMEKHFGL